MQELEALTRADALGLVFPPTPHSIRKESDGTSQVYDLLISTGETVAAVAYDEADGWVLIGKTAAEDPKEAAVDDIIEHRGYEIADRERVLEFVTEIYATLERVAEEAEE